MKKTFFLLLLPFFSTSLFSQIYVDKIPIDSKSDLVFVKVCPRSGPETSCSAHIDYGQEIKTPRNRLRRITDKNGNIKYFNSEMAIMNFMFNNNFDIYRISDSSNCVLYVKKGIFPLTKPD